MYVIRDVFKTKPGQAKHLVSILKNASAELKDLGVNNTRVLTDTVSTYWTVIWESEAESITDYIDVVEGRQPNDDLTEKMKGYMDHVIEGHREILKVA